MPSRASSGRQSGSTQAIASSSSTRSPVMTTRSASQPRQASITRLEEPAIEAGREVQVADLDDPQAVERLGQSGDRHVPLAELQAERLVAGQPQQPGAPAGADQGVAPVALGQIDASRTGRRSPRVAAAGR